MKSCVGIAAEDFMSAANKLEEYIKEIGNFDFNYKELIMFKRIYSMTFYDHDKKEDKDIGFRIFIFRENWNGSLLNINIPLLYSLCHAPVHIHHDLDDGYIYDITLRPYISNAVWKLGGSGGDGIKRIN